jgi:carbonic anhydrase
MGTQVSNDKNGTPTSLLLSIVCAVVVFALAEIQNSFTLGEAFSMRYVLMSYVGLGLTLAFFWKRLEKSPFLKVSAAFYLFGLWVSLFITTLAPILLQGENPFIQRTLLQQFGLGFVAFSGIALMIALLQKQKMVPSLIFTSIGALGLILTSAGSFFYKAPQDDDNLFSSVTHSGKKEAAVSDKSHGEEKGEEEISAHNAGEKLAAIDASHGEHAESPAEEGHDEHEAPAKDAHAAPVKDAHALASHDEVEAAHAAPAHDSHEAPAHGDSHAAPAAKGHEEAAPKATHGVNESHAPAKKAVAEKVASKGLKLSAKALPPDLNDHHAEAPSKAGHAVDDKEEAAAHPVAPAKPSKKSKTASLEHAILPSKKSKAEAQPNWAYDAGANSPEHWGELADQFRKCTVGQQQSPIDIPSSWPLLEDISLDYKLTSISALDNGHTIQFNVGDQNYATIAGNRYKLLQFHIHTPSEHRFDGKLSPMEIHFVHKDAKDRIAVIGIMVEVGAEQKVFNELWNYVPQSVNNAASPKDKRFNIASLLPSTKPKVYRYRGSLTTPPCSENVLWSVVADKTTLSAEQIDSFKTRYKNNARPVQKRQANN